jgi:uncharacterized protein with PIN domain
MKTQTRFLSLVPPEEEVAVLRRPRGVQPVDLDETLPIMAKRPALQPDVLPMKCLRCNGPVERGVAPVSVQRNGYRIAWESVPAWVCTRCELPYFEPREVERVRTAVKALRAMGPRRVAP